MLDRPDPGRLADEIKVFERRPAKTGGIVFTGSSSIRLWTHLKKDFPGLPILNRGFGGSIANDLVAYFETLVARHEPKLLVTYCGSNDLEEKLTVEDAFGDYVKFLGMTHDRFPETRVILTSVKISPKSVLQVSRVHELNHRLQSWATTQSWIRFLDCTTYLADASAQPDPKYFLADQVHLNAAGYAKWQAILDPILREEWARVE